MEVTFTGSWYDETAEKEGANKLIEDGCVLISQHADSMGAPTACETAGVPDVSYNGSTESAMPGHLPCFFQNQLGAVFRVCNGLRGKR